MEPLVDLTRRPVPDRRVRNLFWGLLALTLGIKLVLAAAVPVLGDEAYFFLWGANPALGYYDHPPLAGWLLSALMTAGEGLAWLRLPSVLASTLMALGAVALLGRRPYSLDRDGATRAYLVGMVFLLLPIHLVGVFMLTDTPLVLCSFASGLALMRAAEDDDLRWYAAAGIGLGLAFLSKYLAVLLGLGYLVWWLGAAGRSVGEDGGEEQAPGRLRRLLPGRRRTLGFIVLLAAAAPFVLFNLAWNAGHCWSNVVFNLFVRHAGEHHNYSVPRNLLFYAATLLYMVPLPALWLLWRRRGELRKALVRPPFRVAAAAFGVPMSALLLFALTEVFGAYWVLSFFPFFFLLLHPVLGRRGLTRIVLFLAVFSGLQVTIVGAAALAPTRVWRDAGFYQSMVTMEHTDELLERLDPFLRGSGGPGAEGVGSGQADSGAAGRDGVGAHRAHLAATGYSLASILSYGCGATVSVIGPGTHYAREDDFLTDFRTWQGDRVVVVSKRALDPDLYRGWFERVRTVELPFHGVTLHLLVGEGFHYDAYRAEVLAPIRRTYYRLGDWLPGWVPRTGCPFCDKYFPGDPCSAQPERRATK